MNIKSSAHKFFIILYEMEFLKNIVMIGWHIDIYVYIIIEQVTPVPHFWPSFSLCRFPVEFYSTTKSDLGTVSLKRFFTLISNYFWATPVWVSSTISVLSRLSEIWIFADGRVDGWFYWICHRRREKSIFCLSLSLASILARIFGTGYISQYLHVKSAQNDSVSSQQRKFS